jgi:heme/copper-type cytochrome/quinol oxidase subunit 4
VLAARGARDLDNGEQKVGDENAAAALKRTAVRLHVWAFVLSVTLLLIAVFIIATYRYELVFADF